MSDKTKNRPAPTETRPPQLAIGNCRQRLIELILRAGENPSPSEHDEIDEAFDTLEATARAAALEEPPLLPLSFPTWMATRSTISREDYDTVKHWWKKYETEHLKPETVASPERESAPRPQCVLCRGFKCTQGCFCACHELAAASSPAARPQGYCGTTFKHLPHDDCDGKPFAPRVGEVRASPAARTEQPTPSEREIQYNDEMRSRLISLVSAVNVLSACDGEYRAKIRTPQMPTGLTNAWAHVNDMIVKAEKHMRNRRAAPVAVPDYMQIPKPLSEMTTDEAIEALTRQRQQVDKALERLDVPVAVVMERPTAYWSGLIDGVTRFAWWKDGVQYVGTCGTTLKAAIEEIRADSQRKEGAAE